MSGSLAYQHILELAGYEHDRLAEEYRTTYREAAYVERILKQYGLDDVHIERFKIPQKTWDGELGELWLLGPSSKRLIMSYRDVAASLAPGSKSADITSELVYVGRGEDKRDYVDKNVAGKIVLASGSVGPVHNLAVREFGAAGVVSFANSTGKPIDRPDQIASSNLGGRGPGAGDGQKTTFGIILSHRLGTELVERLEKHETLKVRALVKATEYDAEMQVPTCTINEVTQNFFEYVGDTNREKVQNRAVAYSYRFPILDPQGTRDQFYYSVEKHYGSSDHAVFLQMGVPAVLFNNWPDIARLSHQ